jgi:hypothetical protein
MWGRGSSGKLLMELTGGPEFTFQHHQNNNRKIRQIKLHFCSFTQQHALAGFLNYI